MKSDQFDIIEKIGEELGIKLVNNSDREEWDERNGYCTVDGVITSFRLTELNLQQLPECIYGLTDLIELNLYGNKLSDFSFLSNFKKLSSLNLGQNSINNIDSFPSGLPLETFYIWDNNLKDITKIGELEKLIYLSILENKVEDLSPLKKLKKLKSLYASSNKIKDISPLLHLNSLKSLELTGNVISDITGLQALTGLSEINLGENKIQELCLIDMPYLIGLDVSQNELKNVTIKNCPLLQELFLGNNQISSIKIENTKNIRQLSLSDNEISDISFVTELVGLEAAYFYSNRIKKIPPIYHIKSLYILGLHDNQISEFPDWLVDLNMENASYSKDSFGGYSIHGNPIENVPTELLFQSNESIKDYLKSLESGAQPINEIKVILLGEGAAGKTSLMNYLKGEPYQTSQPQTHGINLEQCIAESGVTLKIWDFGGQDIMHHTHQFFLTQKSIYVLVLNARENTDTEKWLKLIQVFGGDSPIIIVTNKIDENPSAHENIKYLTTKYPTLAGRYVRISCEKGTGLTEFTTLLTDTIKELFHIRTQWSNSWLAVKRELEEMRKGDSLKDYIQFDKYQEICERHSVNIAHSDTLITWLHQLGIITYFPDPNLSETNVINPSWLTEAFYAIINSRDVADEFGKFSINDLTLILNNKRYPKHKYNFLTNLMMKFELCYPINSTTFLIPDLLHKEEAAFAFDQKSSLKFKYKYQNLLPKAILPKFIVRRHSEIKDDKKWRTGLLISDAYFESESLIRVDEDDKEISVYVNGSEKRGYLASIISTFEDINKLYDGLEYEKLVPCCCNVCIDSENPYYYKYDVLINARKKGRLQYICEISNDDVWISTLLGTLITKEELEQEIQILLDKGLYKVEKYLVTGNVDDFITIIKSLFASVSYLLFEKSEKSYHTPLFLLLRSILGSNVRADEIQAKGRADIIIDLEKYVYILELKLDTSAKDAMNQIHENKYYEPYYLENKTIILLGINFSSKTRNIAEVQIERLNG